MLPLIIVSVLGGILTILSPCVLALLPVIVGGTASDKTPGRPFIIAGSLAVSVVVFTLLLKYSTSLLGVSPVFWQITSGIIILLVGITFLIPRLSEKLLLQFNLKSNALLGKANQKSGVLKPILIGAALGPVFNSCSPTYALILATVFPASFSTGLIYTIAYSLGLSLTLLAFGYAGQKLVARLGWAANPHGVFRRVLGIIFILVGVAVIVGFDKDIQTWVLDQGWYAPIGNFERGLFDGR